MPSNEDRPVSQSMETRPDFPLRGVWGGGTSSKTNGHRLWIKEASCPTFPQEATFQILAFGQVAKFQVPFFRRSLLGSRLSNHGSCRTRPGCKMMPDAQKPFPRRPNRLQVGLSLLNPPGVHEFIGSTWWEERELL